MEKALRKNPQVFLSSDNLEGWTLCDGCSRKPFLGVQWTGLAVWRRRARMHNNQSWTVLRNWAIEFGDAICYSQTASSLPSSQNISYITPRTGRGIIQTMAILSVTFCAACAWMGTRGIKNFAIRSFGTSTHTERLKTRWHLSQASTRSAS